MRSLGQLLPVSAKNFSFDFKLNSFLRAAHAPRKWRHPLWLGSAIPSSADDPLHPDLRSRFGEANVLGFAADLYQTPNTRSHMQRLSYQYCRSYLADDILHKVDRASMAASLEARSPFLDRELIELMASLPPSVKLKFPNKGKAILKEAMNDRLPSAVINRTKKGFGIPVTAWLRGPLNELVDGLLSASRIADAGYVDPARVRRLIDEHRMHKRNHRKVLWTLLSFELWREARGIPGRA